MSHGQEKFVRFQDWRSEKSFNEQSPSRGGVKLGSLRSAVYSVSDKFQRGLESSSERIKSFTGSLRSLSFGKFLADDEGSRKILDPQGSFLQKWNKFRTGFIAPSSRVFGRGVLVEDSWEIAKRYLSSYFIIDILAVLPLPQVIGAAYYLLSIERETTCWVRACGNRSACRNTIVYCDADRTGFIQTLNQSCPIQTPNATIFDFGYSLMPFNLNLKTSTFVWEICFAVFISISGLVLFSFLIGNMQTYLQSTTLRLEEMRVKRRDAEQWMSHRLLPESLRSESGGMSNTSGRKQGVSMRRI
ncbi:Cyclic nucleotide-gated ion channel 1 [Sesamum angolense]|uniref:Cyclic nucleotide-gated ion channel 1 n=1 Tax=Sesamum angolense TaxID=2727404 RepID=A0AAE1X1L5_9LAMI|nr:Cyclic nucleotide-gated ion channel 1 [Sesamum angolense]